MRDDTTENLLNFVTLFSKFSVWRINRRGNTIELILHNRILIAVLAVVAFLLLIGALGGFGGMMGGYCPMCGFGGASMMLIGLLFGALVLIALVLFIFWLMQQLQRGGKKKHG